MAAAAGSDEILVSEATRMLAAGAPYNLVDRGQFELTGLPGPRTLSSVMANPESTAS